MSHSLERLELFQYFSDPNPHHIFFSPSQIPEGWEGSPNLPSEHVDIWNTILFKTELLSVESKFRASFEAKDLSYTKKHAQDLASALHESLFTLASHRLDTFRPPLQSANIVSQIDMFYSCLSFDKKCAIHCQLIKVEMEHLTVLIGQASNQHEELK